MLELIALSVAALCVLIYRLCCAVDRIADALGDAEVTYLD